MKTATIIRRFFIPAHFVSLYYLAKYKCLISPKAEVEFSSLLTIGKNTRISSFTKIKASEGPLKIGANVSIAIGCFISSHAKGLEIGDDCMIGPNTCIVANNYRHDKIDIPIQQQGPISKKGVKIANNVSIGANCSILDGADIGSGVIISPNSVVSYKIPSNVIVMGNPAKVVFKRR